MGPNGPAPTVTERRWLGAITAFGCIACYLGGVRGVPAAVHHIIDGNRRMGHRFTLPLCDPGHHQNGQSVGRISLHPGKSRMFIATYGTELQLLAQLERILGFPPATEKPPDEPPRCRHRLLFCLVCRKYSE